MNQHKMNNLITKIISGGQTGVDRAALNWAIQNNILHGGWCPKDRRSEDRVIPDRYLLQETESKSYKQPTKWNIRESDATLIITLFPGLTGGSLFIRKYTQRINKPCLHVTKTIFGMSKLKYF